MISFDTVSILEPNFNQLHFFVMSTLCSARSLSMLRQEKMYAQLDFINFLYKTAY